MPNVTDENRFPEPPPAGQTVPTTPADNTSERGAEAGLWSGGRWGMNRGRHVGRTILDEDRALAKRMKFQPTGLARLQAATRRALGR